ncbi:TrmB family transcriptional regulator [Candidatus Woesearchaeota archaeon]|nr:TrmB family transcriptional regulator [Candidatus Woesearchaeota archaeon]
MAFSKTFLDDVKRKFDLNIYEAKIWTALLSRGIASAGTLSEISNVPRSRSYDVLESLEKKGFVIMKLGKPINYIAVPPEEVVKRMKQEIKKHAEQHAETLQTIKEMDVFSELELLYKNGIEHIDPTDMSGAVVGREAITAFVKHAMRDAKKSITIVTTKNAFTRKVSMLKSAYKKAGNKSIKITFVGPVDGRAEHILKSMSANVAVHSHDKIKGRFIIIDNELMIFMMYDSQKDLHPSYEVAIWTKAPFFVKSFENLVHLAAK